ncbi:hypothetical protein A9257_04345 [Vibrio cyclitrophicus]|jgi:hypothetical protein|nr:hypothetical protein A9257_04345 [Vibrio cyclitrophicus]
MHPVFKVKDERLPIKTIHIPEKGCNFTYNGTTYIIDDISYEITEGSEMTPIIQCREKPKPFSLNRR